jgi:hypothetical protein
MVGQLHGSWIREMRLTETDRPALYRKMDTLAKAHNTAPHS